MAFYRLESMLERYAQDFLVLEINHLFVSTTLREEIWLLQQNEDADILRQIISQARDFDLTEIDADRNLDTYSGGQQAIIACLLVMAAITDRRIHGLQLLLVNVMESISRENRRRLTAAFGQLKTANGIRIFTGDLETLEELA